MNATILEAKHYQRSLWKNGKGTTTEIAKVFLGRPEAYAWRVSIADVVENGDFSRFESYQRIITVLSGDGMRLEVDGEWSEVLRVFQPFTFDGEASTRCELLGGPLRDFNLIYDPEQVSCQVDWLSVSSSIEVLAPADDWLVFTTAPCEIYFAGQRYVLGQEDSLHVHEAALGGRIRVEGANTRLCFISFKKPHLRR